MLYDPYVLPHSSEADLDWSEFDKPLDPAAGTGAFLADALTHEADVYAADPTGGALGRYA
jgi:hypothetical protein